MMFFGNALGICNGVLIGSEPYRLVHSVLGLSSGSKVFRYCFVCLKNPITIRLHSSFPLSALCSSIT